MAIVFKSKTDIEQEEFINKQNQMLDQLKYNTGQVIESRFPQYHQINLYDGTKSDIPDGWDKTVRVSNYSVVKGFKQDIISANNSIEVDIKALSYPDKTIVDIEAIGITAEDIKIRANY